MACWADPYIKQLAEGLDVTFKPRGNSMKPRIHSGDKVILWNTGIYMANNGLSRLEVDTVVLCKVAGKHYLHKIKAVKYASRYLISNEAGKENGWIGLNHIYGVVHYVERGVV